MKYFGPSPLEKLSSVFGMCLFIFLLVLFSRWLVVSSPFPDLLEKAFTLLRQELCCSQQPELVQIDIQVEILEDGPEERVIFVHEQAIFLLEERGNR